METPRPELKRWYTRARRSGWVRLLAGSAMLAACVAFFASGYSPPGASGEVLRHNQRFDIDASPLFYSEVENMQELESGLARLMGKSPFRDSSDERPRGENTARAQLGQSTSLSDTAQATCKTSR